MHSVYKLCCVIEIFVEPGRLLLRYEAGNSEFCNVCNIWTY
jgi:hypothetical protein